MNRASHGCDYGFLPVPEFRAHDWDVLQRELQRALGDIEARSILPSLKRLESGAVVDPDAVALGVVPSEERVQTYYRGLERAVRPRLSRLGSMRSGRGSGDTDRTDARVGRLMLPKRWPRRRRTSSGTPSSQGVARVPARAAD